MTRLHAKKGDIVNCPPQIVLGQTISEGGQAYVVAVKQQKFGDITINGPINGEYSITMKTQDGRYGTPEWEPTKQNCIEEARGFVYANNGAAYGRILEGNADDQK